MRNFQPSQGNQELTGSWNSGKEPGQFLRWHENQPEWNIFL